MSFQGRVLTVLIASPGDAKNARAVIEGTVTRWNRDRARARRVVLLPARWEVDAVPCMGFDGQSVVNRELVDVADIVVAVFRSRLGTPTARAASGTVEEIDRALSRGAPVHVYLSEMPHPNTVDPDELKRLRGYRSSLQGKGLFGTYESYVDLAIQVRTALDRDVDRMVVAEEAQGTRPSAGHRGAVSPRVGANGADPRCSARDKASTPTGETPLATLGRNLRAHRLALGLSQEGLAERIGVHRVYLGGIERGERNLSLSSVERLADRLGVSPFDLLQ